MRNEMEHPDSVQKSLAERKCRGAQPTSLYLVLRAGAADNRAHVFWYHGQKPRKGAGGAAAS